MRSIRSASALFLACGAAASAQPANDSCSTPDILSGFTTVSFDNSLATTDGTSTTLLADNLTSASDLATLSGTLLFRGIPGCV